MPEFETIYITQVICGNCNEISLFKDLNKSDVLKVECPYCNERQLRIYTNEDAENNEKRIAEWYKAMFGFTKN